MENEVSSSINFLDITMSNVDNKFDQIYLQIHLSW